MPYRDMPPSEFNLPPGVSSRDIEGEQEEEDELENENVEPDLEYEPKRPNNGKTPKD